MVDRGVSVGAKLMLLVSSFLLLLLAGKLQGRAEVCLMAALAGFLNIFGVFVILGRERVRLDRFANAEVPQTAAGGEIRLEGRLCDVSVLFTDLRGFTRLSEHLPPQEVMRLLNDYFEEMVRVIDEHGGWVDKFMGDGLLAVFGEKRGEPDHAARAVACMLKLRECLARFNVERGQRGLATLKLGAAVNSGTVVAGTVGSKERLDFTVIGDTVNVASRLEGLNAKLGTDLLVAESVYERTRDAFAYRPMGEVEVRGHDAVTAYRLLGRKGGLGLVRGGLAAR